MANKSINLPEEGRDRRTEVYERISSGQRTSRLEGISLPPRLKRDFRLVYERWIKCSGPAWTVDRLKYFKNELLLEYSGATASYDWFRKTRYGKLIGVFGFLRVLALSGHLRQVIDLLQIYTEWKQPKLQLSDIQEIKSSIESPKQRKSALSRLEDRCFAMIRNSNLLRSGYSLNWPIPILQNRLKPSHFENLQLDLVNLPDLKGIDKSCDFEPLIERALGAKYLRGYKGSPLQAIGEFRVGAVHMTPNPGLKTRYFASPNVIVQRALDPLKRRLGQIVSGLPWDCTMDQSKADKAIQERLRSGRKVYSVDLHAATDHFPWSWQKFILRLLFMTKTKKNRKVYPNLQTKLQVKLLVAAVEKGKWSFNLPGPELEDQTVKWSKGQPLGLGPSFFLFTLSHGILLWTLARSWEEKFFVLGDDVVILDDALYEEYIKYLNLAFIPISHQKTYQSSRYATFAGKSFTRSRIWYNPSWDHVTKKNFIDVARFWPYWRQSGKLFREKDLIEWVLSLPEPYGSGQNPKGLSLNSRLPSEVVEKIETLRDAETELTYYSTVSIKSLRPLPEYSRRWFNKNLELIPSHARNREQRFSHEMRELFWQSSIPFFQLGPNAQAWRERWSLGSSAFWRKLYKVKSLPKA